MSWLEPCYTWDSWACCTRWTTRLMGLISSICLWLTHVLRRNRRLSKSCTGGWTCCKLRRSCSSRIRVGSLPSSILLVLFDLSQFLYSSWRWRICFNRRWYSFLLFKFLIDKHILQSLQLNWMFSLTLLLLVGSGMLIGGCIVLKIFHYSLSYVRFSSSLRRYYLFTLFSCWSGCSLRWFFLVCGVRTETTWWCVSVLYKLFI